MPPEILCGLIKAISGENMDAQSTPEEYKSIYNRVRGETLDRMLPLTLVAWDGLFPKFWAWLPEGTNSVVCRIEPEKDGQMLERTMDIKSGARKRLWNGKVYVRARIEWDAPIPYGYYTFSILTEKGEKGESFLISSPTQLPDMPKRWGAFAPAYALRSENTQGLGGYSELLEAARVIKQNGGEFLATLPLLPIGYEGKNPETSPYSPLSRLFWNEIYLDVTQLPGPYKPDASLSFADGDLVDYSTIYKQKKDILLEASQAFFEAYPDGDEAFQEYVEKNSHLREYADFRARKHPDGEYAAMVHFHLYTQYACHLQLARIREEVEIGQAAALYLDYTVGVHPDGFDAQRLAKLFLKGYQVGAPPDKTFIQGQTWGFEPMHPRKLEESRFWYLRDCLHHYFQYSKIIRIDHVMGLYRLFCVPDGLDAGHGTYIYYNLNAQIGVLCLEAWRHGATVVGEDLGVVPERIREAMERHRIGRMWIGQNDIGPSPGASFKKIKQAMIASFNTHDMFPFAAYMQAADLETLHDMGILKDTFYTKFKKEREKKLAGLRRMPNAFLGALEGMAASKAEMVMVNMEDLWEETIPQNIPGTTDTHPNWRKRYKKSINAWTSLPLFQEAVNILNKHRMVRP